MIWKVELNNSFMSKEHAAISKETITKKVMHMIAETAELDQSTITENSVFNVDIVLDSLSFAEMLMECEEEFDIEIPVEDANNFKTVGDLINYLTDKTSS